MVQKYMVWRMGSFLKGGGDTESGGTESILVDILHLDCREKYYRGLVCDETC